MFPQYVEKYKEHLTSWVNLITGKGSSANFDYKISAGAELNTLRNATSSEQIIHLSNAYYDQISSGRTMAELYKQPKDYLSEYKIWVEKQIAILDKAQVEVSKQTQSIEGSKQRSKSMNSMSGGLQLKLSSIKSDFDA